MTGDSALTTPSIQKGCDSASELGCCGCRRGRSAPAGLIGRLVTEAVAYVSPDPAVVDQSLIRVPVTAIDFADIKTHPQQLQVADWASGAVPEWATHRAVGGVSMSFVKDVVCGLWG